MIGSDLMSLFDQDLNQAIEGSSDASVKTVAEKITALLRVFYTVVLSLGDSISTLRGGQITVGFLVQVHLVIYYIAPISCIHVWLFYVH